MISTHKAQQGDTEERTGLCGACPTINALANLADGVGLLRTSAENQHNICLTTRSICEKTFRDDGSSDRKECRIVSWALTFKESHS